MLVISRRVEESIFIAGQIEVRVLKIDYARVSLGIAAPREIQVLRSELFWRQAELDPETGIWRPEEGR